MKRKEGNTMTFRSSYSSGILSNLTYRPILPYRLHFFYSIMSFQRQLLEKTQNYTRLFCASILGIIFALLLCLAPLHWVQFQVLKDREKLFSGLWVVCHHHLCWNHTSKAPYYLQFSRAFFLISVVTILITTCLSFYFIKGPRDKTHIDLDISILCFISGACLFVSLILFLMQVKLYNNNVMEAHFLLPYRLNCWASVFFVIIGFISGLNHISSRISLANQNLLVIPVRRSRMEHVTPLEFNMTNVQPSVRMPQESEMCPWPVVQQRAQLETGTQTEPDLGNTSGISCGLSAQARLATEKELMSTRDPGPEAERTGGNVMSNEHPINKKQFTNDQDGDLGNSVEKNDDKTESYQI